MTEVSVWSYILSVYLAFNFGFFCSWVCREIYDNPRWKPERDRIINSIFGTLFPVGIIMMVFAVTKRIRTALSDRRQKKTEQYGRIFTP